MTIHKNTNELLNPLGLSVSIRKDKIRILGNEARIRYYLVSFFWRYFHYHYYLIMNGSVLKEKVVPDLLLATGITDLRFSNVPKAFTNAEVFEQDSKNILETCKQLVHQKGRIHEGLLF